MDEVWAPVEDYPDYAVSNFGEIVNLKYGRPVRGRPSSYGLWRVTLYNEYGRADFMVSHIVAKAFTGGYKDNIHIYYRDGDKSNNHILNLRFGRERGLGQYRGGKQPEVLYRRLRVVELNLTFKTVSECAKFLHTTNSSIYKVLRGELDSHLGYTFEYFEEKA